jgi:hypothetical protein
MKAVETPAAEPQFPVPDTVKRLHHLKPGAKIGSPDDPFKIVR